MKKIFLVLLSTLFLFTLTSCAEIEAILGLIPKFDTELPNLVSGRFAKISGGNGSEKEQYLFNSKTGTFEFLEEEQVEGRDKGTYSVEYSVFAITECAGKLTLRFENGEVQVYEFKLECTATGGPEALFLGDKSNVYYYWGDA